MIRFTFLYNYHCPLHTAVNVPIFSVTWKTPVHPVVSNVFMCAVFLLLLQLFRGSSTLINAFLRTVEMNRAPATRASLWAGSTAHVSGSTSEMGCPVLPVSMAELRRGMKQNRRSRRCQQLSASTSTIIQAERRARRGKVRMQSVHRGVRHPTCSEKNRSCSCTGWEHVVCSAAALHHKPPSLRLLIQLNLLSLCVHLHDNTQPIGCQACHKTFWMSLSTQSAVTFITFNVKSKENCVQHL